MPRVPADLIAKKPIGAKKSEGGRGGTRNLLALMKQEMESY